MLQQLAQAAATNGGPGGHVPHHLCLAWRRHREVYKHSGHGRESRVISREERSPARRSPEAKQRRLNAYREARRMSRCQYREWITSLRNTGKFTPAPCSIPSQGVTPSSSQTQRATRVLQRQPLMGGRQAWFKNYVTHPSPDKSLLPLGTRHFQWRIASWNVQGLKEVLKCDEITQHMTTNNIHILCLSETHQTKSDQWKKNGYQFYFSGNSQGPYAGVGFVISPIALPFVHGFLAISDRICRVSIRAQPRTLVLFSVYAPSQMQDVTADLQRKTQFWKHFSEAWETVPTHEVPLAMGDLNTRIHEPFTDSNFMGTHHFYSPPPLGVQSHTPNLDFLEDFLTENHCCLPHTFQRDRTHPLVTYKELGAPPDASPYTPTRGHFHVLDYAIVPILRLKSVHSVHTLPGLVLNSQHYPLLMLFQVRDSRPPKPGPPRGATKYLSPDRDTKLRLHQAQLSSLRQLAPDAQYSSPSFIPCSVNRIEAYTDGSCPNNRAVSRDNPAGWGWCLRTIENNTPGNWVHAAGFVSTDPDSSIYGGAEVGSNNTAELQALIELLDYLLRSPPSLPVKIFTDSQYCLDIMLGVSHPSTHVRLVTLLGKYWKASCAQLQISVDKVPGHAGVEGNEIADRLALRGYRGDYIRQGRHLDLPVSSLRPPRLAPTTSWYEAKSLEDKYSTLHSLLISSAQQTLQPRPPQQRQPYIKDSTWNVILELHATRNLPSHTPVQIRALRNKAKRLARKDKRQWLKDRLLEDYRGTPADRWRQLKQVRKGYQPRPPNVRNDKGVLVPREQRSQVLADFLATVWKPPPPAQLCTEPIGDPLQVNVSPFTMFELNLVLHKAKRGRAPGPDQLPTDFLVWASPEVLDLILSLLNHCFLSASSPAAFNKAVVAMLPKPNQKDPSAPGANRPISLTQSLYKLYTSLLHLRLRGPLDGKLRPSQYGFRARRSTSQPLHMVRRIIELYERQGQSLHVVSLDWSKAFDTISHDAIRISLNRLGVPEPLIQAIMALYSDPQFTVRDTYSESSSLPQCRGVRQGCPLSPLLFIAILTCVMHDVDVEYEQRFGALPWVFSAASPYWDIEYADDTLLLSRSSESLNRLLHLLEIHASKVGLLLNHDKCEHLPLNTSQRIYFSSSFLRCSCSHCWQSAPHLQSEGPPVFVPVSTAAKYLGIKLTKEASPAQDSRQRLGKAIAASKLLGPFFRQQALPPKWRYTVYVQIIQAIMLYSGESLSFSASTLKRFDAHHFKILRQIFGFKSSYYHRVIHPSEDPCSNQYLHDHAFSQSIKAPTPSQRLSSQRMKLFGHVLRHPDTPEHQVVFNSVMSHRRLPDYSNRAQIFRRGASRVHWVEQCLTQACTRSVMIANNYSPNYRDLASTYYDTPFKPQVKDALGSSLYSWYDTTDAIRQLHPYIQDRQMWKKLTL